MKRTLKQNIQDMLEAYQEKVVQLENKIYKCIVEEDYESALKLDVSKKTILLVIQDLQEALK
jgi:hypothetical protein